jgi:hypothetical protein
MAAGLAVTRWPKTSPGDRRANRRYPIILDVQYKLLKKSRVEHLGVGWTLNISSGGVLLKADAMSAATDTIELALSWPFVLKDICKLKLVMRGRIVRCDADAAVIAVNTKSHEFRTAGVISAKGPTMAGGMIGGTGAISIAD